MGTHLLNSKAKIEERVRAGSITWREPLLMLFSRLLLFALFQAIIAVLFYLNGHADPWQASIPYWLLTATLTNITCFILLSLLTRREGIRLLDLYRVEAHSFWREAPIFLGILLISAPLVALPNPLLGAWFFGDANIPFKMMFQPIPLWLNYLLIVLFPISIALTEIPTYYAYVMPRLMALSGRSWPVLIGVACMHAAQHITLPLIFNGTFILWRLLMFLPFALWVAFVIYKRPRQMPYLMLVHAFLDASLPFLFLTL